MNYSELSRLLHDARRPIVLLEGTRSLPEQQAPRLTSLAVQLARAFPNARFRTGNAQGSDEAFAAGVARVDSARIEYVLPYATHRRRSRSPRATTITIEDLSTSAVNDLVDSTNQVSPQYRQVAVNYREGRPGHRVPAVARLILRDTLKARGTEGIERPAVGIFFVNPANPDQGGTGHTIRVCRDQGVPVVTQFEWVAWLMAGDGKG